MYGRGQAGSHDVNTSSDQRLIKGLKESLCLLAPGPLPDEDGGLGPDPGAHRYSRPKHGEQVDFLHHQAGPVLDRALWDRLVGLRGDCHVGFTPVENITQMIGLCVDHATCASHTF